ncbi:MAG: hypothetical protein P4L42_14130 [Desulfocapsaceae bacterium]|nr:hypothetical protein [Desulfocapsaceae bacterium]
METTEKIVEAYVRYVKGCFTLPNIKCGGQFEIDLLAIQQVGKSRLKRYHIESGVSISGQFSRLTNKPYSVETLKIRGKTAEQRRTLGYFVERKFGAQHIQQELEKYGFLPGNYSKVIVSWGWDAGLLEVAQKAGVELWDFKTILQEIAEISGSGKTYFTDDTMRTLQLMAKATIK